MRGWSKPHGGSSSRLPICSPPFNKRSTRCWGEELLELEQQMSHAAAALERMRRAADWRQVLMGAVLAGLVVGITLGGFWLLTRSREELNALRAKRAQLQSAIDALAQR